MGPTVGESQRCTAVFGGSFDPPHVAHVGAVRFALDTPGIDRVLVVPVHRHAFDKVLAPFSDRMEMVHRVFSGAPRVEVSAIEATLAEPNYTITTLRKLAELHPHDSFRLLVGTDVLAESKKWRDFDQVTKLAPPLVLGRAGSPTSGGPEPVLPEVASSDVRHWLTDDAALERLLALVPRPALEWIVERALYGVRPSSKLAQHLRATSR